MRRKLKLEDLAVDTFATTAGLRETRGTVRGFYDSYPFVCGPTAVDDTRAQDCGPSLELSCGHVGGCDTLGCP